MKFPERLHTFVEPRFQHPGTHILNILNTSLTAWSRYFTFLETIRVRYTEVSAAHVEAMQRYMSQPPKAESSQVVPKHMTEQQLQDFQRRLVLGLQVHLEIESFYIFANILLDRIASTFRYYFWRKPNWNHMHLVSNLTGICAKKDLLVTPDDLLEMPANLQSHIVEYRNKRIEHVEEPRLHFGTTWGADKKPKINPMLIYASLGEAQSAQQPSGDLDEIMDLLDRYMTAMLDFFEANADKSILPPKPKTEWGS